MHDEVPFEAIRPEDRRRAGCREGCVRRECGVYHRREGDYIFESVYFLFYFIQFNHIMQEQDELNRDGLTSCEDMRE